MIGTTLGSYRIVRELGTGGMGVVYVAEHPMIGKKAAIKLLRTELSRDTEIVGRFFNEAKAVTTINHPGLVDVYDFGYAPDGSAYIVMEFLDGESLATRLRRDRTIRIDIAVAVMRQLAGALGAAHAHRIVHRDLKPDNIFLCPDPDVPIGLRAKVLDFGIAKLAPELGASGSQPQTRTGMMMGTPSYMAPEQCRGAAAVDARADIYAVGVILYEMLTGRVPFEGEGIGEVIAKHQYEPPPKPSTYAAIPPHLEALIMRMLDKKPEARPQTMEEVARALDPNSASHPNMQTAATVPPVHSTPAQNTTLSGAAGSTAPRAKSGRGLVLGLGALLLVGAVITIVVVTSGGDKPTEVAATDPPKPPLKQQEPPPAQPTPTPEQPIVEPPPKPAKVKHVVESVPPGAEIWRKLDGVRVGKTPYKHEFDPVDGQAVFLVKLANHKDVEIELDMSKDDTQTVKLVAIKRPVAAPTGPAIPDAVDPFKK